MSKGIQYLRDRYQQVRKLAYNSQMKDVKYDKLTKYKDEANKEIQRMTEQNAFENLQEATFYQEKFAELQKTMFNASKNKIQMKDFTNQAKEILKEKTYASRNSYLSQPPMDPRTTTQPQAQNGILQSFFDEKKSKLVPEVGFRSLLQNPPVSGRTFKKRIGTNNVEIDRLRNENIQLRKQLQSGRFGGGEQLQVEIRRQQQRIKFLENQNDRLSRDNTKLKSEKGGTIITTSYQNYDDYLYSPYVLNPRENDLAKISTRGSDIDTLSNYTRNYNNSGEIVHYQNNQMLMDSPSFNGKAQFGTMSEFGDIQREKDRYSIFEMSKSRYSEFGDNNGQGYNVSSGNDENRTANRNKTAFFKNSGMIVRDQDIEIAFKRTQSQDLRSNRIILYLNNKIGHQRKVNIIYEYENNYYDFRIAEKFTKLESLRQARQVVEVRLKTHIVDINSVIEVKIQVDGKMYVIWLPVMFIRFKKPVSQKIEPIQTIKKIVTPSKLFMNEQEASKVIDSLIVTGRGQASLWGESAIHEGPIRFTWKSGNKLEVATSKKWVDMITFLMFDYR